MKLNIRKIAELTGVSVRTLHYYDEIELVKPDFVDEQNGYRYYGDKALYRMQEVLFYRELGFSLKDIKEILSSPNYNKAEALSGQKQLLILKKERLERIIAAIESVEKGEKTMDFKVFTDAEYEKVLTDYKDEAKRRWGDTDAYRESEKKTAGYSREEWEAVGEGLDKIIYEFSLLLTKGAAADGEEAAALVEGLKNYITETQYTCTNEILVCLADMYAADERFKKNIDKFKSGTAEFMSRAMKQYCNAE